MGGSPLSIDSVEMLAKMLSLLLFMGTLSTGSAGAVFDEDCTGPTGPDFRNNFIGHCENYQISTSTCSTAWTQFLTAFSNKNPRDVKEEDYNEYFNTIPITIPRDKAVMWDNTRDFTELITMMGTFLVSSHDVTAAKVLNDFGLGFCWCSEPGNRDYINTNVCPTSFSTMQFWAQFSVRFAQAAEGIVFLLANGELPPVYNKKTFFGCYELPRLDKSKVSRLAVLNIHLNGQGESCGTSSLYNLCQDTSNRGIPYICYDINGTIEDATAEGPTWNKLKTLVTDIQSGKETRTTAKCGGVAFGARLSTIVLLLALQILFW